MEGGSPQHAHECGDACEAMHLILLESQGQVSSAWSGGGGVGARWGAGQGQTGSLVGVFIP